MDELYELKYHSLEEKHWWFESRRDIIFKLIQKMDKNSKILEIGCSGGPLIKFLKQNGFNNIYGIDKSKKAIELCKSNGLKNIFLMDGLKTRFNNEEFDIIIASDILEHIKEDNLALLEWNRILKKGGRLILFVPAFNFLWSEHDEVNKHYKRYSKSMLITLFKKSNFRIEKISYWNFILFFPASLFRIFQHIFLKNKIQKKDQLYKLNNIINKSLIFLLKLENLFLKKLNFPIGVSVFALVTKEG